MSDLDTYRRKRDFARTPEPEGGRGEQSAAGQGGIFVVHKHAARRLHYDLRLEHGGVLWSWAVTRGPSLDPSEKRLAVHVEDHPLDYADFEGTIPKGDYGGGTVLVWDEGRWTPEADPEAGMMKGHLTFTLEGHKLHGSWHLVRMRGKRGETRDNWLLIKAEDEAADDEHDILEQDPLSVVSGRDIEQVASAAPARKSGAEMHRSHVKGDAKKPAAQASDLPMPSFIKPCLATLAKAPPSGPDWLHEVKFDGYRVQAHVSGGEVHLHTRSGLNWTGRFGGPVRAAIASLPCRNAILDCEIVAIGESGISSFSALQAALSANRPEKLICFAFDLLFLDGEDLRSEHQLARKGRLADLLAGQAPSSALRYSEHFMQPGQTMLNHVCRMGLEGVISKRADAPYRSGRSRDWIKAKCSQRQEFVIAGYLPSSAAGRPMRSLLLAYREQGQFHYAGRVGTGFDAKTAKNLVERLDTIAIKAAPFDGPAAHERGAVWVEPKLVVEVAFREWTDEGVLRQASFQGLREDKTAREVVAERPTAEPLYEADQLPEVAPAKTAIQLTHPGKLLWTDVSLSKAGLLDYYSTVWPRLEPHLINRPLSLLRTPDGISGEHFFQKHVSRGMPDAIRTRPDPADGKGLIYIKDFDGMAALVQFGCTEIHAWGASVTSIERPDRIIFDLDPAPDVEVAAVRAAAIEVRDRLLDLGFTSFAKTSGGKGYHVVVPLTPSADWATVKGFSADFARTLAQAGPKRYTATLSKAARRGRIFIDYLRNGRGATAVSPYSTRARAGAPVSLPITWNELESGFSPADARAADTSFLARPDPWAFFAEAAKPLARSK